MAKKSNNTLNLGERLGQIAYWLRSHTLISGLLLLFVFGSIGAWFVVASRADTTELSYEGCFLRGRKGEYVNLVERNPDYRCFDGQESCRDGAGTWTKPIGKFGYCTNAVSPSIGEGKCENELKRQYVGTIGCARWWKQTTREDSLQCLDNSKTYRVASPYDYCGAAVVNSAAGDWIWPVKPDEGVGSFRSGHYARDFRGGVDTPVRAVASGTVTWRGTISSGCGTGVILRVAKPGGGSLFPTYEHLRPTVSVNQTVSRGEIIGYLNAPPSGVNDCWTGYHLHLGVQNQGGYVESHRSNSSLIDPCKFIAGC